MLRDKEMDIQKFMKLLEEWKGDEPWCMVAKRCRLDRSVISRIKNGEYHPGYRTITKLAHIAPLEYRNKLYNELLEAAGLGGIYAFRRN